VLLALALESEVESSRLRRVQEVLDGEPLLSPADIALISWASGYYRHPIGSVAVNALPKLLRRGARARLPVRERWLLTAAGRAVDPGTLKRAPRQCDVLKRLRASSDGLTAESFVGGPASWRQIMSGLISKAWVEVVEEARPEKSAFLNQESPHLLSEQQAHAVREITEAFGSFSSFVLDGVTGSGKTEIYLSVIESALASGRQALVLIPEIALSKQMVDRLSARFTDRIVLMHSGLSDGERMRAWLLARSAEAGIVVGTRSAIWTPLPRAGVIIVDEEHDLSYKQQEGFRYSARDVAVYRAHALKIPIVLGSATPSLETYLNIKRSRYRHLELPQRALNARPPKISLVSLIGQKLVGGLSAAVLTEIADRLQRGEQSLLFLNRRGYAPALICHDCGWVVPCLRCDAKMVWHKAESLLRCHHCSAESVLPDGCGNCSGKQLVSVGVGTEQLVEALHGRFPEAVVLRFDRDSTRRRGTLESLLEQIHSGAADIIVGTQMLAKGHDFPAVTLVGIVDTDSRLYSADFRSTERLAQLLIQVAGRAGRAERAGAVLVQTHVPDHPLLNLLLNRHYREFCEIALQERREAELPPFTSLVLVRAEANRLGITFDFLKAAAAALKGSGSEAVTSFGPIAAPMERRAGRFRAHLLLQAERRKQLDSVLPLWLQAVERLPQARRVRWSIDVDPQEML